MAPGTALSFTVATEAAAPVGVLLQSRTWPVFSVPGVTVTALGTTVWQITFAPEATDALVLAVDSPAWALMGTVGGDGPYPLLAGTIKGAEASAAPTGVYTIYIGTTEIQLTVG